MLFVFNYAYWCPTRLPFEMTFVSFYSNTTGATSGSGTANPSRAPEFTPGFNRVRVVRSLVFCIVFLGLLFFLFCPFCFLSFYNLRILITPLVSSNSFYLYLYTIVDIICIVTEPQLLTVFSPVCTLAEFRSKTEDRTFVEYKFIS